MKLLGLAAALLLGLPAAAPAAPLYHLVRSVPLGPPDKWDYLTFDAATQRVLIAHGSETTVVSGTDGRLLGRLAPVHGAHGQVVVPGTGHIFADSGDTGTVTIFDGTSFKALKTVPAGQDADAVVLDPASHRVIVMDGDGEAATLIDAATGAPAGSVKLGGSPEFAAADGKEVFINIASTGEMVRMDGLTTRINARWKLPDCVSPHGLAVDPASHLLFATCLNATMLVVDGETGKIRQRLPIGRGTDAAAFDPVRKRAFSSNGEGTLSVFEEQADGTLRPLGEVKTAPGARTMAVDPASGRVYLVTAGVAGTRPAGHGGLVPHFAFKPGTVKLLMLDPGS